MPPQIPRILRPKPRGFKPCKRRTNCTLCLHSQPISSYTCPNTGIVIDIEQNITCTDIGIYILLCRKQTGACSTLHPTYVGECGQGPNSSFTHRLSKHLQSATNRSEVDTEKPVGRHFRIPGHHPHGDMAMIPIEEIVEN